MLNFLEEIILFLIEEYNYIGNGISESELEENFKFFK